MKYIALVFIIAVLLSSPKGSQGAPCTQFKEFTLFPNPVRVGQTAHLRAVVQLPGLQGPITNGTIKVTVNFNGELALQLAKIPLCDSTPSIVCSSLGAGDNALSFDFDVPQIPYGSYDVSVTADVGGVVTICNTFTVNVTNPAQKSNTYISFIQAQLAGTAQFENSDVTHRAIGDVVQIGPIGYAPTDYAVHYGWGTFLEIKGSGDNIVPSLSSSGYVWGLYGNLSEIVFATNSRTHTYVGRYYVGYVSNLANTQLDMELIDGTFTLTWTYNTDYTGTIFSKLTGTIKFDDEFGTVPQGWSHPIVLEKFGSLNITTDAHGVLMATGNKTFCLTNDGCPVLNDTSNNNLYANTKIVGPANGGGSSGLTDTQIILAVCLTVGVAILAAIIIITALWIRRTKKFEEEDGIFSAARKPEYGSALVVDDIIQETREHGASPMIPTLDRHPGDSDSESDLSEDESELEDDRRKSRFSRDAGSPSNNRRTRSPSFDDRSRERARESGRRQRSRSNSVESPRDRRRSRSPPRKDDYSSSYYSDAGSSASRESASDD